MSRSSIVQGDRPAVPECLSWSHDGMLAVAIRDHVDVYIPRHGRVQPRSEDSVTGEFKDWHRVQFRVNLWAFEELPRMRITSSKILSVGEEQSESEIAVMKWSLPGLAQYSRCALAILTTNLRLSLWAPLGDPRKSSCWTRVLVLNTAMERYLSLPAPITDGPTVDETLPRLRGRIRQFAWACPTRVPTASDIGSWSAHLLMAANENNEVFIMNVKTTKDTCQSLRWSVEVMEHFTIATKNKDKGPEDSLKLNESYRRKSYAKDLAWSPWYSQEGILTSTIAYTAQCQLQFRQVQLIERDDHRTTLQLSSNKAVHKYPVRREGRSWSPLIWLPKITAQQSLTLLAFSMDGVTSIEMDLVNDSYWKVSERSLGGRLDAVTGVALTPPEILPVRLYATTLMSTAGEAPLQFVLPMDSKQPESLPNWQEQIREQRKLFGVLHELGDRVAIRTWGLTHSPLGDLVVTCCSLHPSDVVEYKITHQMEYVLTISSVLEQVDSFSLSQSFGHTWAEDISIEALAYSIKRWLFNQPDSVEKVATLRDQILQELLRMFDWQMKQTDRMIHDHMNEHRLQIELKHAVMMRPKALNCRLRTAIDIICEPESTKQPQRRQTASLYLKTLEEFLPLMDLTSHIAKRILVTQSQAQAGLLGQPIPEGQELCEICKSSIPFTNIGVGYCEKAHQFSTIVRCGLTFQAIQAPGISKICGMCGMQTLNDLTGLARNEHRYRADDPATENTNVVATAAMSRAAFERSGSPGSSLPPFEEVLFDACDVCIYCGGKYLS
ncbi:hypothetical protein EJ05DRAFT_537156 [Pseudovirgaria hyperparasitica]|uniref:Transcription factor IIIC 90kDa subunit N-terminal domain-containing protein n=1 Tax=Pseudovirgaria hyperparasitica TaxID=470096 RepID=A0A6A6WAU3_9PEZI|nr:uncharacterized protein EJ05DRAFT_537156 [Pseudovirgaria hyperparasitica]KAF2759972.1 hypothetical protein EJ05DRAFT_537156 [Pseudovirgaria hyperparasitica]